MNKFEKASGEIDKVLTDFEEMMNKVQETLRAKMKDVFKTFFDSYPEVKTIHWTQYAPYFNDGEECVFSVNVPYFTRTEHAELEDREHAWGEDDDGIIEPRIWDSKARRRLVNPDVSADLIRDMDTFAKILQSEANEAVMQAMFGNHVWVKAHRDGFEVDDYDHD